MIAQSCHQLTELERHLDSGFYLIDPADNPGDPFEAYCDFDADDGVGYTMIRIEDPSLQHDQSFYRQACQDRGLELVVPRTRAHAAALMEFNDGSPPNIVGVYRKFPGAQGLHNWEGRCQGQPCNFYLSDTDSAGCTEFQPDGTNTFDTALVRYDDDCFFGAWRDDPDQAVPLRGSVICSTNDAGPPVQSSCLDYRLDDSVYNAGPHGISGVYPLATEDGESYEAYCDMTTHGGGWTLTLKVDGDQPTFLYDSPLWTNDELFNPDAPGLNRTEAKLHSFSDLSFTQLLVGLEAPKEDDSPPQFHYLPVVAAGESLQEVFAREEFVATHEGRDAWRGIVTDPSLQPYCNREGLNNAIADADADDDDDDDFSRVRIGIIANEQEDCETPDSRIGLGGAGTSCDQENLSAGNTARCGGDEGDVAISAMGALFVRHIPVLESCQALLDAGFTESGVYPIDPGGAGPFNAHCEMELAGGGWTLVAINGLDDRPDYWSDNDYPRPGASRYGDIGRVSRDIARTTAGDDEEINNYSIDAQSLFEQSSGEVLAYVGGSTTDFITVELPQNCNFFDGSSICEHNSYTELTIYHSDGSVLTDQGQACTTGAGLIDGDIYDEFGLHLLEGTSVDSHHCANTDSTMGHFELGRLYTTFESSQGAYWDAGVHGHWREEGDDSQPGFLLLR